MADWFDDRIIDTGRLALFCFFTGMVFGFLGIRLSVRMIRAGVKWWPGNVTPGGLHIHHAVFGIGFMVLGGVTGLALPDDLVGWRAAAAAVFGIGTALVLDEYALILHLSDVYWSQEGRTSVNAVFAVVAVTGMLLLGLHPFMVEDVQAVPDGHPWAWLLVAVPLGTNLALAAIAVLKGKVWTGMLGMFVPFLLIVGAVRLARPHSPWARWRYREGRRRGARKLARAVSRERRLRAPVERVKDRLQDLVAGAPDGS
jgi:hypothetical protein